MIRLKLLITNRQTTVQSGVDNFLILLGEKINGLSIEASDLGRDASDLL